VLLGSHHTAPLSVREMCTARLKSHGTPHNLRECALLDSHHTAPLSVGELLLSRGVPLVGSESIQTHGFALVAVHTRAVVVANGKIVLRLCHPLVG
jgi:hypothetical protein